MPDTGLTTVSGEPQICLGHFTCLPAPSFTPPCEGSEACPRSSAKAGSASGDGLSKKQEGRREGEKEGRDCHSTFIHRSDECLSHCVQLPLGARETTESKARPPSSPLRAYGEDLFNHIDINKHRTVALLTATGSTWVHSLCTGITRSQDLGGGSGQCAQGRGEARVKDH